MINNELNRHFLPYIHTTFIPVSSTQNKVSLVVQGQTNDTKTTQPHHHHHQIIHLSVHITSLPLSFYPSLFLSTTTLNTKLQGRIF